MAHLDHLLEGLHVLLHAVVRAQVGDEVTGVHAVETVEERVHAGMQVDQVHLRDVPCYRQTTPVNTPRCCIISRPEIFQLHRSPLLTLNACMYYFIFIVLFRFFFCTHQNVLLIFLASIK